MWTSTQLHEELAVFYRGYRGVTAPANTFSENLWRKIEETEDKEGRKKHGR